MIVGLLGLFIMLLYIKTRLNFLIHEMELRRLNHNEPESEMPIFAC